MCRKRIRAQLLRLKTDFCDTIETKAVVVISLDSRANSRQKSEKHELRFVRSHLCSKLSRAQRRGREMLIFDRTVDKWSGKLGFCRGKGSGHPWVPLLLFAIWWEITFCSTLAKQNSDGGRPPKPNRGCKFRASIEHKLTRGLSQKTVCVYAIRSALSGLSSQFCYNVTKCWSGCRKTNISLVGKL